MSLSNIVRVVVPPLVPLVIVKVSVLASICTKVIVLVWVTVLPNKSVAVKVTVTTPLLLHRSAGFTAL